MPDLKPLEELTDTEIPQMEVDDLGMYITEAMRRVVSGNELSPHEVANMVYITIEKRRKAVRGNPRASKAAKENAEALPSFDEI